jgi:hypothetical protein
VTHYTARSRFCGPFPGSRIQVSLPACQQQVLDRIERNLEDGEPKLRSMFAIFTRLTRDDGTPKTESLHDEGSRFRRIRQIVTRHAVVAIPVILCLVALFAFAVVNSPPAHVCRPAPSTSASAVHTKGCQAASESYGRP